MARRKARGVTCAEVRELALSLPEAVEEDHWGRPSFRVRKKIFATLWEDEGKAVLKASSQEQAEHVTASPDAFSLGPWSRQGWMHVDLSAVDPAVFRDLLVAAWRRLAPKRAVTAWDGRAP